MLLDICRLNGWLERSRVIVFSGKARMILARLRQAGGGIVCAGQALLATAVVLSGTAYADPGEPPHRSRRSRPRPAIGHRTSTSGPTTRSPLG